MCEAMQRSRPNRSRDVSGIGTQHTFRGTPFIVRQEVSEAARRRTPGRLPSESNPLVELLGVFSGYLSPFALRRTAGLADVPRPKRFRYVERNRLAHAIQRYDECGLECRGPHGTLIPDRQGAAVVSHQFRADQTVAARI